MSRTPAPQSRNIAILHEIVQAYVETGEPVASRTIARRFKDDLSPATIRNVMADLEEEGYLSQPHTSAGRIPTDRAFRSYVKTLASRRLVTEELKRLQCEFQEMDSINRRFERTSQLLVQMTHGMGIAAAIPVTVQTLDHVDFLALGDHRILIVVITADGAIHNKVVTASEDISQDELVVLRNYLNVNFSGWPLSRVREELDRRLQEERAAYDAILRRLRFLYAKGLLDVSPDPEVHVEGASNLVSFEMHVTRETMQELFRALEQKKKILHLLECFLEQPEGEVAVQVGLSQAHPSMGELSLIGMTVTLPNGVSGKVAVLGPMRMNYERGMSAVLHVAQALQNTTV